MALHYRRKGVTAKAKAGYNGGRARWFVRGGAAPGASAARDCRCRADRVVFMASPGAAPPRTKRRAPLRGTRRSDVETPSQPQLGSLRSFHRFSVGFDWFML